MCVIIQGQKCMNTHARLSGGIWSLIYLLCLTAVSLMMMSQFELQAAFELHHHNSRFKQAFTNQAKECIKRFLRQNAIKMQPRNIIYNVIFFKSFFSNIHCNELL